MVNGKNNIFLLKMSSFGIFLYNKIGTIDNTFYLIKGYISWKPV